MSEPPVFEADGLTKFYGHARGVENFSLTVHAGEIFGFLGPNGAGKTTVIRSTLGLLRLTAGEIRLFGDPVRLRSDRNHERLGYLPADLRLWPRITGRRISDLMLKIGNPNADCKRRDELASKLELDLDRRVKSLSLGNRQKIGLLLALQHDPRLVILDEPTSGLDPLVRRTVCEILRELSSRGVTIIYSSHNLSEVEQICSRVGILRRGRLAAVKSIDDLRAEQERILEFSFKHGSPVPDAVPPSLDAFKILRRNGVSWQVSFRGSPDPLIRWLAQYEIEELSSPQITLEESFLAYYQEQGES